MVANRDANRIIIDGLTKTFGGVTAVNDLSFTVEPGTVTGFLGPNGAGKTTTLRMLLGLISPDAGEATFGGHHYRSLPTPARMVGVALEAMGFHPARTGRNHLRVYCTISGYPLERADEVLDLVGLADAGRRRVRGYSLGMRQRLALAAALLGDPAVLILDEPGNGLDPEGIVWMRKLLRDFAAQGRTVLVSSHVLSEIQQLSDHVVIINQGRLVHHGPFVDLADHDTLAVSVRTPAPEDLLTALATLDGATFRVERSGPDALRIIGMPATRVGDIAFAAGIRLHELSTERSGLEEVFFALTTATARTNAPDRASQDGY